MKVLKFGGSSVSNSENIKKVVSIISEASKKDQLIIVVSAFGKTTNKIIEATSKAKNKDKTYKDALSEIEVHHIQVIKDLFPVTLQSSIISRTKQICNNLEILCEGCFLLEELTEKTLAITSSFGEQLSSFIISEFAKLTLDASHKNSQDLIITDNVYNNAQVDFKLTNKNCTEYFANHAKRVTILGGFIAKSKEGEPTVLGRDGSDYSAAIYAAAIQAKELQIWTDINGMYTANPNLVKNAKSITHISYKEAMEMSHFGAKVIYPPTIQPVMDKNIPIIIKSTFDHTSSGTLINNKPDNTAIVKGITHIEKIALLTIEGSGLIGVTGFSKRLFEALATNNINIILITQASSEHSICIAVFEDKSELAVDAIHNCFAQEISQNKVNTVCIEKDLSILALVGDNMKSQKGLSGELFSTLGKNNINIRAIAQGASEKNISVVIASKDVEKGLNCLHKRFFEPNKKEIHLFITGVGNVGSKLIEQVEKQQGFLNKNHDLNIKVVGICNSKKMVFDSNGIDLSSWKTTLQNGDTTNQELFYKTTVDLNLPNSIFIDNTANNLIPSFYKKYLNNKLGVVTCNKIACSSEIEIYNELKEIAQLNKVPFLYETNVGAGLPIIDTIKNCIMTGDSILKIEAVLSGSLNFIFNNYNEQTNFYEVVQLAQEKGYTEPDPKIDLSGIDVARKILILARESNYKMNLKDIVNNSFLSKKSLESDNNIDFYNALKEQEVSFKKLLLSAQEKNCRLKYVAEFSNGKASVGLKEVATDHPFYNLEGSDNIVLLYTERYPDNPLQIKGAGAGADVTASGLFSDILKACNYFDN